MRKIMVRVGEAENGKRNIQFINESQEIFPGFTLSEKEAEHFKVAMTTPFCYKAFQLKGENKMLHVRILNVEKTKKIHMKYVDFSLKKEISEEKDFILAKVQA